MRKLPKRVKSSVVYKGLKITLGWDCVRNFLALVNNANWELASFTFMTSTGDTYTDDYKIICVGQSFKGNTKWEFRGTFLPTYLPLNLLRQVFILEDIVWTKIV